jgi:hypothetical protein
MVLAKPMSVGERLGTPEDSAAWEPHIESIAYNDLAFLCERKAI